MKKWIMYGTCTLHIHSHENRILFFILNVSIFFKSPVLRWIVPFGRRNRWDLYAIEHLRRWCMETIFVEWPNTEICPMPIHMILSAIPTHGIPIKIINNIGLDHTHTHTAPPSSESIIIRRKWEWEKFCSFIQRFCNQN